MEPRHEPGQWLEEQRKDERGQQVGLAEAQRWKPEEVPELAQSEPDRREEQDRQVRAPAVGEEGEAELGDDEDQKDGDDEAGRNEFHGWPSPSAAFGGTSP